jgi:hypothetical protein
MVAGWPRRLGDSGRSPTSLTRKGRARHCPKLDTKAAPNGDRKAAASQSHVERFDAPASPVGRQEREPVGPHQRANLHTPSPSRLR